METLSSTLSNAKIEVDTEEIDEEDCTLQYECAEADKVNSMGFDIPGEYNNTPFQVIMPRASQLMHKVCLSGNSS